MALGVPAIATRWQISTTLIITSGDMRIIESLTRLSELWRCGEIPRRVVPVIPSCSIIGPIQRALRYISNEDYQA